jgi:hypothetical protein
MCSTAASEVDRHSWQCSSRLLRTGQNPSHRHRHHYRLPCARKHRHEAKHHHDSCPVECVVVDFEIVSQKTIWTVWMFFCF